MTVHEQFNLGLTLRCELPENYFPLHTDNRPAVLIAGGIGITPIKSMSQALMARVNILQLHYAGRSMNDMAFRDRLVREVGEKISVYRSDKGERLNIRQTLSMAPDNAVIYMCGPDRLIDDVVKTAGELNIDPERVRFERFSTEDHADDRPITIELSRSNMSLEVSADQSILDAVLEAGIEAPYSCKTGNCKTCAVTVLSGDPDHRDSALSEAEREQSRLMCPCVSRASSEKLILDI
jgi:ferredoxin-NADP reductase